MISPPSEDIKLYIGQVAKIINSISHGRESCGNNVLLYECKHTAMITRITFSGLALLLNMPMIDLTQTVSLEVFAQVVVI